MSLRTNASEIIRTWDFYTIVKSFYHFGTKPWDNVMISGFVMANKGEKISKNGDIKVGKYKKTAHEISVGCKYELYLRNGAGTCSVEGRTDCLFYKLTVFPNKVNHCFYFI